MTGRTGVKGAGDETGPTGASRRPRTLREYVRGAATLLAEAGVASPEHDARALAAFVLGLPRLDVLLGHDLPGTFAAEYADLVRRRCSREPLQHILGHTVFRQVTLRVEPGVFVPRPETEVVAQEAIDAARAIVDGGGEPLVVDLCCGAGGIAVSVDVEVPGSRVVAVDLSPEAAALTRANQGAMGSLAMRVETGDVRDAALLADLHGSADVVVSNPPYIPPGAVPRDPEVRDHDPELALYGGGVDGLAIPGHVVARAAALLRPGGLLVMEHAEVQAEAARELVTATGVFGDVRTGADLTGRPRFVRARRR